VGSSDFGAARRVADRGRLGGHEDFFVHRLNDALSARADLPGGQSVGIPERDPTHPLIFVCGVPRSGTTVVTQLIAQYFDVGFVDHLTARFYRRPGVGAMLRRSVYGDRHETDYRSEYGRTPNPLDVHAMGWFWRHYYGFDEFGRRRPGTVMPHARTRLEELLGAWQKPVVMLGHYPQLLGAGEVLWGGAGNAGPAPVRVVRVRRDRVATAVSLYQRGEPFGVGGDPEVGGTLEERIAKQVMHVECELDKVAARPAGVVEVSYEDLCAEPRSVVHNLRALGVATRSAAGIREFRVRPSQPPPNVDLHRLFGGVFYQLDRGESW
jgi:hypothetical protein